ncbi:hypothetical protein ACFQMG_00100 [Kitasatospora paranensis]|uniref:Uncharacterized protein n=1 Tax=Kitasatospora paranensis TaxID=258053 RepID=A0ABW2FNX7_9ACTN
MRPLVRRAGVLAGAMATLQAAALLTAQQVFADPTPAPTATSS